MKFIRLHVDGAHAVAIEHPLERVERVLQTMDGANAEQAAKIAQRATDSLNACSDLSDGTLALMAKGGTRFGSLAERVTMVALLWGENGCLAEKLLTQARKEIAKTEGKI